MPTLMKGNKWNERKDALDRKGNPIVQYPVWVEVKHDEIRCEVAVLGEIGALEVQYLSYAGKPLANMRQFDGAFKTLFLNTGLRLFDLGFEANGNFNDSYRWVRSTRGIPADLLGCKHRFFLFDLPERADLHLVGRLEHMSGAVTRWKLARYLDHPDAPPLERAEGWFCSSATEVDARFLEVRERGLEGLMVKQFGHKYSPGKRTDAWLKMKPENDADGVISELHEAVCGVDQPELGLRAGDHLGRIGSVTVRLEDGSEASPHGIPHALGVDMYLNPQVYLYQWCEFKYMERDRQGGYRHPTFNRLREAKK